MGRLLARLLSLLQLLLELRDLRLGLVQRDVLHQHRLRKDVNCVGIGAQFPAQEILGIRIFFL